MGTNGIRRQSPAAALGSTPRPQTVPRHGSPLLSLFQRIAGVRTILGKHVRRSPRSSMRRNGGAACSYTVCGVEVTQLSTNKQLTLSCSVACPVGPTGRYHQVALPLPSASRRARALSLSFSLLLLLSFSRSSRSSSRANMRTQIRYMHANTCKQVSSCTSTHVYIIVKNVRITANRCAFTPACGYASARAHTQHSAQHHARTHSSRTHVGTRARTHVRTFARTRALTFELFGRTFGLTDGRTDTRSLPR